MRQGLTLTGSGVYSASMKKDDCKGWGLGFRV